MKTWLVNVVRSFGADWKPDRIHTSGPFTSRERAEKCAVGLSGGSHPLAMVEVVDGPDVLDDEARDKDADAIRKEWSGSS